MSSYQIPLTLEVEPHRVCDLIVTAIEGGSTYWMSSFELTYPKTVEGESPWYANEQLWHSDAKTEVRVRHIDLEAHELPLPFNVFRIKQALRVMAETIPDTGEISWPITRTPTLPMHSCSWLFLGR